MGWLQKGAQPTDACRAILSLQGVLYKKHLLGGVAKGAFSETEAEARFNKWLGEKAGKIEAKSNKLATDAKSAEKARLAAEAKIKEERAKAIAEKQAAAAAAAKKAEAAAAEAAEGSRGAQQRLLPQNNTRKASFRNPGKFPATGGLPVFFITFADSPMRAHPVRESSGKAQRGAARHDKAAAQRGRV